MSIDGIDIPKPRSAAIRPTAFLKKLLGIWRPPMSNNGLPGPLKLALAVSGGADSMALATLCSKITQLQDQYPELRNIRLQAFVVDHKARPESTPEARQVARCLERKLGLRTRILSLQWPPGVIPSELPNFETVARRLRYQALGKACYNSNIPSLLLGHHQGDVKETLIMRLIEGYRGEGLRGITQEAEIPECSGIYGINQSGGRDYTVTWEEQQMVKARGADDVEAVLTPLNEYRASGFEHGGVRVCRPLLDFGKPALQLTLEQAAVPWVTDTTNHDPTVSVRNTVRYLIERRLLPKALDSLPQHGTSALMLAAKTIRQRFVRRNEQAEQLLQACDVISFNAQSGCLKVRLPLSSIPSQDPIFFNQPKNRQDIDMEHIGARLVRLLLRIVAPRDSISLQTLEYATKAMFWETHKNSSLPGCYKDERLNTQPTAFTAGGVFCQRIDSPTEEILLQGAQPYVLHPDQIWCLSRKPYVKTQPEPVCLVLPVQGLRLERKMKEKRKGGPFPEPPWQLWDGRYWIQVLNPTGKPIKIVPFSPERLTRLKEKLGDGVKYFQKMEKTLKAIRPPHVRYTLPALVDEEDNVLALPSIGFKLPDSHSKAPHAKDSTLQWRIRYKKIVLPSSVKEDRIIALKDEQIKGVRPALGRVKAEEKREMSKEKMGVREKRGWVKARNEFTRKEEELRGEEEVREEAGTEERRGAEEGGRN